mgnify:CR=1 FL=1|jgi:hypothetical protein
MKKQITGVKKITVSHHKKGCHVTAKSHKNHVSPSNKEKLHALKNLEGIWANKDTSFFDKRDA